MIRVINLELAQIYRRLKIVNKEVIRQILLELEDEPNRIDLVLLDKNLVTEEQNCRVYERYFGVKPIDIDKYQVNPQAVKMVSQDFVVNNNILPFFIDENNTVYIAVSNPFDYKSLSKVKGICGSNYKLVIASKAKIQKIQSVVFSKALIATSIEEYQQKDENKKSEETVFEANDIVNSPSVKLVESIIKEGIAVNASDIHLEPFERIVNVRNRIDGTLYHSSSFDLDMYASVSTRIKILAGINIAERRIPQDGRIKYTLNGINYDFRVSTLPTVYGERIVIRILDTQGFSFTRQKLGFTDEENKKIDRMIHLPYGIILLTGPTGCGKSTTLYSFIQEISNNKDVNIITVEDPVEYTIEGVNQVQVNNKANLTFASALRSILRQDPNVIMIGEIRDEETAEIAIRSSITGHLVLSTLHTNDAPGAVSRLVDMGVEPFFVSDALSGVIAQRLVRKLCPHCKKAKQTNQSEMKMLGIKSAQRIYQPVGCPACNGTGYNGRIGIHEVLEVDDDIKYLIQKGGTTKEIRQKARENGMQTLKDTCVKAILIGETSINELLEVIFDIDDK